MTEHSLTEKIASFLDASRMAEHTPQRRERAACHLLDTLGAIVSGAVLPAGRMGRAQAGAGGIASVALETSRATPEVAAYANAMCAHGDETDDAHQGSTTHPGCAVVPAALAAAEATGATGRETLNAVIAGYELCARIGVAMGSSGFIIDRGFDTHAFGGIFGAAAAAGTLMLEGKDRFRSLLSLAAHEASGLAAVFRDPHHVEKAYIFAGKPARDGVLVARTVAAGMACVQDTLDGSPGFFSAFGVEATPAFRDLSEIWAVEHTNIKRWCVGSPAQAALDAVEHLVATHNFDAGDIVDIVIALPVHGARVVDGRDMPTINVQHLVALMLVDGGISFESCHEHARMDDPAVLALRRKATLVASEVLSRAEPARQAIVEIALADGRRLRHHVKAVRGTADNPMTQDEIAHKVRDLAAPILSPSGADALIAAALNLDKAADTAALMALVRGERQ